MSRYVESQALLLNSGIRAWISEGVGNCTSNGVEGKHNTKTSDNGEKNIAQGMKAQTLLRLEIKESEASDKVIGDKEAYIEAILAKYKKIWLERAEHHLGYQLNMDFDYSSLAEFLQFSVNNFGDPFIEGNYGVNSRDFEICVLDWFARLWEIEKDEYWGYVTNGGTEGNLHGLFVGREIFPDGIIYASKESHYSIFKVARLYRMKCIKIETLISGEINCADLKIKLLQNKDKPAIVNITIGTTIKGGVDDLDLVIQTLEECGFSHNRFYIHCDGASFGVMLPFLQQGPKVTFKKPIGSVTISGHKFVGSPIPCGVQIVRKEHINTLCRDLDLQVEYIFSRDTTILGSRNGLTPIFLWYALNRKGYQGLQKEVQMCIRNAHFLKDRLKEAGVSTMLNKLSNTVVFEHPRDDAFIRHWQLCCEGNLAHVIVMPHVTIETLNTFVDELVKIRSRKGGNQPLCIAFEIGEVNCACPLHK